MLHGHHRRRRHGLQRRAVAGMLLHLHLRRLGLDSDGTGARQAVLLVPIVMTVPTGSTASASAKT
jgi:hypothetical protein